MRQEPTVVVQEPAATGQNGEGGSTDTPIEHDPFLVALMEAVGIAVTTEEPSEPAPQPQLLPAPAVQTRPAPSPAPARRERARYSFD